MLPLAQLPPTVLGHVTRLGGSTDGSPTWGMAALAGRLVELCGTGSAAPLSVAMGLVLEAQRSGEPVAWVTRSSSVFHPPDVAASGVDLAALAVVRAPDVRRVARAAEMLVRSGGFGLVVLDLIAGPEATVAPTNWRARAAPELRLDPALLSRLVQSGLAHRCVVLCLTPTPPSAPSIDPLVSLRVDTHRERVGDGRFVVRLRAVKDKRRGPGWTSEEVLFGPPGLR